MIKNLLYSIFLHLALFVIIFFSFKLKNLQELEEKEVIVTLIQDPIITPVKPVVEEKVIEEKQPEIKKEIPKKIEPPKKEVAKKVEKPLPKVEPKKELPKKELPKKEERPIVTKAAPEAKKEAPKEKPVVEKLDKLLDKIIDKPTEIPTKKVEEKPEAKPVVENNPPKVEAPPAPQSIEESNLSPREKFNIQSQLRRCYKKAVDENKPQIKMNVTIIAQITLEGYINSNLENIIDQNRYNNPQEINYKMAIDNVKKAINMCSPLRNLPGDKYDIWKEVSLRFDEDSLN